MAVADVLGRSIAACSCSGQLCFPSTTTAVEQTFRRAFMGYTAPSFDACKRREPHWSLWRVRRPRTHCHEGQKLPAVGARVANVFGATHTVVHGALELRDTCLGSATSGLVARLLCHPLDTAKARLQGPEGSSFRNTWHVLRATMGTEGIGGLYRGIGAVTFGGVPGVCFYLTTYEATKEFLADRGAIGGGDAESGGGGILTHLTAGMIAEVVCCVVFVPVDVVKERLQVQRPAGTTAAQKMPTAEASSGGSRAGGAGGSSSSGGREASVPPYRGSADTLKTILRTEGLRGIYKGYLATLASFGPFSALYFMFYEQAKMASQDLIERHPYFRGQGGTDARAAEGAATATLEGQSARGARAELPVWMTLGNAAAASAAASWLTNPLDLAKLRLQVQRGAAATASPPPAVATTAVTAPYTGMLDALRRSYRAGGLAGLFKGSGARMAFQAPSIAITMAAFEKSKEVWGSLLP